MCVIPFDRERPFPMRRRRGRDSELTIEQRIELLERAMEDALAAYLKRIDQTTPILDATAQAFAEDRLDDAQVSRLPKVG